MSQTTDGGAQEILLVFDRVDAPVLTTAEVADAIGVSRRTALRRLTALEEKGFLDRKEAGPRAAVWWATVAPRLSQAAIEVVESTEGELEHGETVSQAEMKERLGIDG